MSCDIVNTVASCPRLPVPEVFDVQIIVDASQAAGGMCVLLLKAVCGVCVRACSCFVWRLALLCDGVVKHSQMLLTG